MEQTIQSSFENLQSKDPNLQYEAYTQIISVTSGEVDWAYEVWDRLVEDLTHSDNHRRSRAAQFLCGLAKSDPEKRILKVFHSILQVTKDEKFVTARHSLQSIWKIGLAGKEQKEIVIEHLSDRFINCIHEKNYTLIRFDIIQGLRNLYDEIKENGIMKMAKDLIEKEVDPKYKKKYTTVWKNA